MARRARVYVPGFSVHVIHRGNDRMAIFGDDPDHYVFLKFLQAAASKFGTSVHAYALMDTHYHLLVTPSDDVALPRAMQSLGGRYSVYFNRKYSRCGTLWSERYRSIPVGDERYVLTCLRYIEQNPVRAGVVHTPDAYRWSSYAAHAFGQSPEWLVPHSVYVALGTTPIARQTAYRALCGIPLTDDQLITHRIQLQTGDRQVTGTCPTGV